MVPADAAEDDGDVMWKEELVSDEEPVFCVTDDVENEAGGDIIDDGDRPRRQHHAMHHASGVLLISPADPSMLRVGQQEHVEHRDELHRDELPAITVAVAGAGCEHDQLRQPELTNSAPRQYLNKTQKKNQERARKRRERREAAGTSAGPSFGTPAAAPATSSEFG